MSQTTISNQEYPNQLATHLQSTGPVIGLHNEGSINQKWTVASVGGDQITLVNASTGSYASAPFENPFASVVGNFTAYTWQQLSAPGGLFQIATTDGAYVWRLTGSYDGDPVVLQAVPYTGSDSLWAFN